MKLFEHPVLQNLNGRRLTKALRYHVPKDTEELNECARVMRNAMNQPMYYQSAVDGDSMIFLLKDTTSDEMLYAVFVEDGKLTYLLGRGNSLLNNQNPALANEITEAFIADGVVTVSGEGIGYNVVPRGAYATEEEVRALQEDDYCDDCEDDFIHDYDSEDEDDSEEDEVDDEDVDCEVHEMSEEDRAWEQMKPIGREFGSGTEFDEDESDVEPLAKASRLHVLSAGLSKVFSVIAEVTAPKPKGK